MVSLSRAGKNGETIKNELTTNPHARNAGHDRERRRGAEERDGAFDAVARTPVVYPAKGVSHVAAHEKGIRWYPWRSRKRHGDSDERPNGVFPV